MLLGRVVEAAGRQTKSFSLEIAHSQQGSFFDLCEPIKTQTDQEFLRTSSQLAEKLAAAQTHNRIPSGYFVMLDCSDPSTQLGQYIVIKAELDEVIHVTRENNVTRLELLKKVFFGSAKKLYKIGMLFERPQAQGPLPNDRYECILFDDQFNDDKKPAEYFYSNFLGYSIDRNGKIQTQRFERLVESFGRDHISDDRRLQDWVDALRVELRSQDSLIDPMSFGHRHLHDRDLEDQFLAQVVSQLPQAIPKDTSLISRRLNQRKVDFPDKIIVSGPSDDFDDKVKIIPPGESLDPLFEEEGEEVTYTYIRIAGRPYPRKRR